MFKFSVQTTKKKSELIFLIEYFIFKLAGSKDVEMRRKQQTYTHVVESTGNQTLSRRRKQGYGGKDVLASAS